MTSSWTANHCAIILSTPFSIINRLGKPRVFVCQIPFCASHGHHADCAQPTPFQETFAQQLGLLLEANYSRTAISPTTVKSLHALAITNGSDQPVFIDNNLVTIYAGIGDLDTARKVFDQMPQRNAVSWNSLIAAYGRLGHSHEPLELFPKMMATGFRPSQFTLSSILASCSRCCDSVDCGGFQFYPLILKTGLLSGDVYAGTALLGLWGKRGFLHDACKLFDEMPKRNLVTWNSLVSGFAEQGFLDDSMFLFRELLRTDIRPSDSSFLAILSAFQLIANEPGQQIHGLAIKVGADLYIPVANALIDMYGKCHDLGFAEEVFGKLAVRDEVSWNTMITTYVKHEKPEKALESFFRMSAHGYLATPTTFSSVISSCTSLKTPEYGKFFHCKTLKNNLELDIFVGSALVDLYAKLELFADARKLFDEMPERSIASWNSLIACNCDAAQTLLKEMLASGFRPDGYTYSAALKSSSTSLYGLQQLHSQLIRTGLDHNPYASSSIVAAYATKSLISNANAVAIAATSSPSSVPWNIIAGVYSKNGQYPEAHKLISRLPEPDIVSWNISIAACSRNRDNKEAFEIFKRMQTCSILPDNYTFVSLLSVCSKLCNLGLGTVIHGLILKTDFSSCDVFLCNVLMDMYAKCGSLDSAIKVFDRMRERNLISWTVMVSALGLHGHGREALKRFEEMELQGIRPDRVAFLAILSACRHGGLVEQGLALFGRMKSDYRVEPKMDHYHCVVDLLCRRGHVKEAERVITSMPFQPSALIWRTFLAGCK